MMQQLRQESRTTEMKSRAWIKLLIPATYVCTVLGYAYIFASNGYCSTKLIQDSTIMGSVVGNGNPRRLQVSRGPSLIPNGSSYLPGEVLSVNLDYADVQFAYEVVRGTAAFLGGACNGNRFANDVGLLVMPGAGEVELVAGTASHFGGLSLTPKFVLLANQSANVSGDNTDLSPQQEPPSYPAWHELSQRTQIIVGLVVGVMGLALVVILLYCCVAQTETLVAHSHSLAKIPAAVGMALALTSVGLVSAWASSGGTEDGDTFLGVPDWRSNLFAWHPVLMVGGFFAAQVVAISLWAFDTPPAPVGQQQHLVRAPSAAIKLLHVFFQCAAVGTLIAGLMAIVQSALKFGSPSLTSMHSWYGVTAVAMFGTNYLFGSFMGLLTVCRPRSVLHRAFNLLATHRVMGLSSLALTALAAGTGIMTRLPASICFYDMSGSHSVYSVQANPSQGYPHLKAGCKIANGLGITVALAAVFTAVGVAMHANRQTRNSVADELREQATRAEVI